jgi:hypothetical protein
MRLFNLIPLFLVCLLAGRASAGVQEQLPSITPSSASLLGGTSAIEDHWINAVSRLKNGDYATAQSYLQYLSEHRESEGIRNLFLVSALVVQHAGSGVMMDEDLALNLVHRARTLAPEAPGPLLTSAARRFFTQPGVAISDLAAGLSQGWKHLPTRVLMVGRAAMALTVALLLTLFFLAFVILIRYSDRLIHDVSHVFPKAFRGGPLALTVLALVTIVPLSLGAGLTILGLLWLVLLWPYFRTNERVMAGLLAFMTASVPVLNGVYAGALEYPATVESVIFECIYGRCSTSHQARLDLAIEGGNRVHDSNIALGTHFKRKAAKTQGADVASQKGAERHFKAALAYDKDSYVALVNLANVEYVRAHQQCRMRGPGAVPALNLVGERYARASAIGERPVESEYNRSVLHKHLGEDSEAAFFRAQAAALKPAKVKRFLDNAPTSDKQTCPVGFNANVELMNVPISVSSLWAGLWRQRPRAEPLLMPYSRLLVGTVEATFFLPYGLACGLLLLLSGALMRFMSPAKRCTVCGRVTCARCRREVRHVDVCPRCLEIRLKGAFVDSRERWLQERERVEKQVRGARALVWWSVLVPGLSQLSNGRAVAGVTYLFLFSFLSVFAFYGPSLIAEPAPTLETFGLGSWIVVTCASFLYLASLFSAWRMRRSA